MQNAQALCCKAASTALLLSAAQALSGLPCCAEVIKYLKGCGEFCAHIHVLPVYHLSLLLHNSHHGSFGRGIDDGAIDCRCRLLHSHACAASARLQPRQEERWKRLSSQM